MPPDSLTLITPTVAFEAAFRAMIEDYRQAGEVRYQKILDPYADFAAFVQHMANNSQGIDLPPELVPSTMYWLIGDGTTLVGVSRLRHRLNAGLEREGGHIGYDITPSQRRQGYGTRILALTMEKAHERGLTRVLVTCNSENIGSARIIQKNGGKLDNEEISLHSGKPVSRYWIDL